MTDLAPVQETASASPRIDGASIARGAATIAALTIVSRILGLVRTLVFSQTVGATCLGTAYVTANQIPSLVYELVLAGALSTAMVPILARSAERSVADPAEKAQVRQISSALLTWTIIILLPLTALLIVAAGPISALLNPANANTSCGHADAVAATATMLRVFAPQALLYGLSVVLFSLLQAYRRFAAYALAPAVYSLVLMASYFAFVPLGKGLPLGRLSMPAQLELAVGTTLGVAAMVGVGILPVARLRLRLRPVLRLPPGVARRAVGLAVVGIIEVVASDIGSVVLIALANGRGTTGALVLVNYGSQVFATLNAVLAFSVVLSAFPVLSAREGPEFDRTCAGSTRAVLLMACLGMALTAAVMEPAAHVLARQPDQVSQLILSFALFAPGLAAVGVIANLSRVMLIIGRLKVAAVALAGSFLLAMLAQLVLAELAPARLVVPALALGNTIGQTAAAIPLVIVTRRIRGPAAVRGSRRALLAGLAGTAVAGAAGIAVSKSFPVNAKIPAAGAGLAASCAALIVYLAVVFLLDAPDARGILGRLRIADRLRPQRPAE